MRESLPDTFGNMDQIPKAIQQPAAQSGIFKIGGDTPIHRLGFGTMRLTGRGIWGEPEDPAECIAVLRRAVDLGINFIAPPTRTDHCL